MVCIAKVGIKNGVWQFHWSENVCNAKKVHIIDAQITWVSDNYYHVIFVINTIKLGITAMINHVFAMNHIDFYSSWNPWNHGPQILSTDCIQMKWNETLLQRATDTTWGMIFVKSHEFCMKNNRNYFRRQEWEGWPTRCFIFVWLLTNFKLFSCSATSVRSSKLHSLFAFCFGSAMRDTNCLLYTLFTTKYWC